MWFLKCLVMEWTSRSFRGKKSTNLKTKSSEICIWVFYCCSNFPYKCGFISKGNKQAFEQHEMMMISDGPPFRHTSRPPLKSFVYSQQVKIHVKPPVCFLKSSVFDVGPSLVAVKRNDYKDKRTSVSEMTNSYFCKWKCWFQMKVHRISSFIYVLYLVVLLAPTPFSKWNNKLRAGLHSPLNQQFFWSHFVWRPVGISNVSHHMFCSGEMFVKWRFSLCTSRAWCRPRHDLLQSFAHIFVGKCDVNPEAMTGRRRWLV